MKNHKKTFFGCVATSLFLHVMALVCLERYSLWFASPQKIEAAASWLSQIEKREKDQILEAAFSEIVEEKPPISYRPESEAMASLRLQSPVQIPEPDLLSLSLFPGSFPAQELLAFNLIPTFSVPTDSFNLLEHLPKDLLIPAPSAPPAAHFPPPPQPLAKPEVPLTAKPPVPTQEAPMPLITYLAPIESTLAEAPKRPQASLPLPEIPQLPSLADLDTASYSDSFDAELVFLPREGKAGGYIFALTLIPRPDLALPKIRQHYLFLVDRSNSITQERLSATKSAIHKALEELSAEDTFNIIAFDNKMEKMSPHELPCAAKSLAIADAFLGKLQLGSFFTSSDLYRPLFLTVPGQVEPDEVYTAILLTDGETLGKKQTTRALLQDWTQYNGGKVSLFALGVGTDPHFATLDATTFFNKGKSSSAPTNRGLKRKLLKLIKTIQTPVAKSLSCKAISRSPQGKIQLYPKSAQAPHLYLEQPYVILGETDSLDDFVLFVQGRLKDRWLNIKKNISFVNAKKGNKSLKKEWAIQQAYSLYEKYLREENPKYLAEATHLLEPFDLPPAFR